MSQERPLSGSFLKNAKDNSMLKLFLLCWSSKQEIKKGHAQTSPEGSPLFCGEVDLGFCFPASLVEEIHKVRGPQNCVLAYGFCTIWLGGERFPKASGIHLFSHKIAYFTVILSESRYLQQTLCTMPQEREEDGDWRIKARVK